MSATTNQALDQPFTLKPGETASVGPERIQLQFERVVIDSRCPRDVRCVRAGEATVRVRTTLPGKVAEPVDLIATPAGEHVATGGYTLTLSDLVPVPLSTEPVKASDYRATFVLATAK